ncbi:hypothetical protein D9M71_293390 [compost metagenome]
MAGGNQAARQAASHPSNLNNPSSEPPASQSKPSPTTGIGNINVPNRARGNTAMLTQGTATRLASGALILIGKPSASSTGSKPIATIHCARVQACHSDQPPSRPLNTIISTPTAENDNQNPGCKLASGSSSSTPTSASNKGKPTPRWRKRRRQSNTNPSMIQARRTGT